MMVLAGTGHRAGKTGGHSPEAATRLARIAEHALRILQPDVVITGMALGWDTALAEACTVLYIPFVAAIPDEMQPSKWPQSSRDIYFNLLEQAYEVKNVSGSNEYHVSHLQERNEWMYDASTSTLALWDGSPGGTYNYLKYAVAQATKPMYNVWPMLELADTRETILNEERLTLERLIIGFPDGVYGAFPRPGSNSA